MIGRQGRTAKALRAIMKASGTKDGKRVLVESDRRGRIGIGGVDISPRWKFDVIEVGAG